MKVAFPTGNHSFLSLYDRHRTVLLVPPLSIRGFYLLMYTYQRCSEKRWLSTHTESTPQELTGKNAYELLGVSESSSFTEIKASFRKLAKETHPDLAQSSGDSSMSQRFVQILAAYEILSDSEKRAHYDRYLLSERAVVEKHSRQGSVMYTYGSRKVTVKQMEVVEWLKWYRYTINDILSERRVVTGSGYFDALERDFYSAIHAAYYGPEIESMDLLPDCFEAEERSVCETPEVLHFVSGRYLFGMVCIADRLPELSQAYNELLPSFACKDSRLCESIETASTQMKPGIAESGLCQENNNTSDHHMSDAYKNLELHVSGRFVAEAIRVPPKGYCNGMQNEDSEDHIHVYLNSIEDSVSTVQGFPRDLHMCGAAVSRIPLGTISGLGTSPEEGSCFVYNSRGIKTHVVMKHRTLLVKHLHWYQMRDEASVCECRCSRACLPPSRRLHPAMYLLALAYRTLDIENAKRRKQTKKYIAQGNMFRLLSWWKKLV